MKLITLEDIKKIYGGNDFQVHALDGINLEIEKGEMLAVMGTSGSGKSTLLNILGLIDVCTSGEYYLQGKAIASYSPKELAELRNRAFGFVLQDFALIERYTVSRNVMLPLYYSDVPKYQWKKRAQAVLEKMGIEEKEKRYPTELSGGQRQRVAIARALVNDADVLLADEPTGALDSGTSEEIMRVFMDIKKQGKTVIVVTHDSHVAEFCDRIIRIDDGRII